MDDISVDDDMYIYIYVWLNLGQACRDIYVQLASSVHGQWQSKEAKGSAGTLQPGTTMIGTTGVSKLGGKHGGYKLEVQKSLHAQP